MNVRLCSAAALLVLSAVSAPAQTVGTPGGTNMGTGNPRDRSVEEKFRSDEIERVKRDAEKSGARPDPAFPRIKDDFERIQLINSGVLQVRSSGGAFDYARIYDAAGEIKKRAARLSASLFPGDAASGPKEKSEPRAQSSEMKSLLKELDGAISDFVTNPMFRNLRVVDTQSSAKARRDLEKIVRLSAMVRREADRRRKPGS
jgi:hypothetical protein